MSFVVDASVVAAWFLPDEANELAEKALQLLESEDDRNRSGKNMRSSVVSRI